MEEDGILNAWKKKTLMKKATTTTANSRASNHPSATFRP